MGNICLYDEAFTKREMREETGRSGICKIAECDYSSANNVRGGEWKQGFGIPKYCSECGFMKHIAEKREYNFCPNCGAKME